MKSDERTVKHDFYRFLRPIVAYAVYTMYNIYNTMLIIVYQ